ncbi:MAG TPA: hypothetical protein VFU71_23235 [Burkholderiaceae bacterium]|nr:hypothetical protein [Burkholderiaceae bacterium]
MSTVVARTLAVLGATAALATGTAHASDVHWSVGIQAPIAPGVAVGTVFTNGHVVPVAPVIAPPVYVPAPVVYAPPPVVYAPPPVVYAPPVYAPVYTPRVVYGAPVWVGGRWVRYPVHYHAHPGAWRPAIDHRGPPLPGRMPGREIRY